eukprot:jgi/Chrzof1/3802/Cz13g09110.t1
MLVMLLVWLCQAVAAAAAGGVPMSSSVILFYNCEYELHYGQNISQCSLLLRRAKQQGSDSVNIVPTHYWVDKSEIGIPNRCNPDMWRLNSKVDNYCALYEYDKPCTPFTAPIVQLFQRGFQTCLKEAYDLGFNVLISPHLDDGTKKGWWRQMLLFDPLKKDTYGYSYWDIMLQPILKSVNAVFKDPKRTVWFGLEGEMAATLFWYPKSWITITQNIWSSVSKGGSKVLVGVTVGHNFLPGVINHAPGTFGSLPVTPYSLVGGGDLLPFNAWPSHTALAKNLPAIKQLLSTVDFIGVSNYGRVPVNPKPEDFEWGIQDMAEELKAMGISLSDLMKTRGTKLLWSEFAIGGGKSRCSDVVAGTPFEVGYFTSSGISTTYTRAKDPWKQYLPNASVPLRDYMRNFYVQALKLLAKGGGKYPISGVYLWNVVSWDVQGLHPASSSKEGSYADPVVTAAIKKHNKKFAVQRR